MFDFIFLLLPVVFRQAVKVCGQGDCSEHADRGFACAPIWTCKDNRIITDGKVSSELPHLGSDLISSLSQGIIDVRRDGDEEELGCVRNSGTIDVSDKKCPNTDEVCCKNPNFRAQQCERFPKPRPTPKPESDPAQDSINETGGGLTMDWKRCGRNGAGRLNISGSDDPTLAQPGEFPHMGVIYRSVSSAQSDRQRTVVSPPQGPGWSESLHWRGLSHCSKQAADCGPQVLCGVSGHRNKI